MNVLVVLIPVSLALGVLGLLGFLYLLRHNQYEDAEGHAARILSDRWDDAPKPDAPRPDAPRPDLPKPDAFGSDALPERDAQVTEARSR